MASEHDHGNTKRQRSCTPSALNEFALQRVLRINAFAFQQTKTDSAASLKRYNFSVQNYRRGTEYFAKLLQFRPTVGHIDFVAALHPHSLSIPVIYGTNPVPFELKSIIFGIGGILERGQASVQSVRASLVGCPVSPRPDFELN